MFLEDFPVMFLEDFPVALEYMRVNAYCLSMYAPAGARTDLDTPREHP